MRFAQKTWLALLFALFSSPCFASCGTLLLLLAESPNAEAAAAEVKTAISSLSPEDYVRVITEVRSRFGPHTEAEIIIINKWSEGEARRRAPIAALDRDQRATEERILSLIGAAAAAAWQGDEAAFLQARVGFLVEWSILKRITNDAFAGSRHRTTSEIDQLLIRNHAVRMQLEHALKMASSRPHRFATLESMLLYINHLSFRSLKDFYFIKHLERITPAGKDPRERLPEVLWNEIQRATEVLQTAINNGDPITAPLAFERAAAAISEPNFLAIASVPRDKSYVSAQMASFVTLQIAAAANFNSPSVETQAKLALQSILASISVTLSDASAKDWPAECRAHLQRLKREAEYFLARSEQKIDLAEHWNQVGAHAIANLPAPGQEFAKKELRRLVETGDKDGLYSYERRLLDNFATIIRTDLGYSTLN